MPSKKYITILVVMAIISGLTVADWHHEQKKVDQLRGQNAELRQGIRKIEKKLDCIQVEYLGEFTATFYTDDTQCCGKDDGITKTGTKVSSKSIAVDPSVIPLGSLLYVEGCGFRVADDVGGAIKGRILDVYVPTREEALELGVKEVKVFVITKE